MGRGRKDKGQNMIEDFSFESLFKISRDDGGNWLGEEKSGRCGKGQGR